MQLNASSTKKVIAFAVVGCIGLLGTIVIATSHAATSTASIEPELGTISGGAVISNSVDASNGKYVRFNAPNTISTTTTTCGASAQEPTAPVSGLSLAGCEDFNGSNSSHFFPYNGGGGNTVVGAGRVPSQCSFNGGELVEMEAASGATCGGLVNFSHQYGLWEVRMRAYGTNANGSGSAPHPVLLLWPDSELWNDGEIDFAETSIGQPMGAFLHCTGTSPQNNCFVAPKNGVDYSQYHTYSILWRPTGMIGYIDGQEWWTAPAPKNAPTFMPNGSMHLSIQIDNLTDQTPVNPATLKTDWVHMYQ